MVNRNERLNLELERARALQAKIPAGTPMAAEASRIVQNLEALQKARPPAPSIPQHDRTRQMQDSVSRSPPPPTLSPRAESNPEPDQKPLNLHPTENHPPASRHRNRFSFQPAAGVEALKWSATITGMAAVGMLTSGEAWEMGHDKFWDSLALGFVVLLAVFYFIGSRSKD